MKIIAKVKKIDEELAYRTTRIQFGSESLITPLCSSNNDVPANDVNEIYRNYSKDCLQKGARSSEMERGLNLELKKKTRSGLNVCFVDYNDSAKLTDNELGLLTDLQYQYSQIAVTPIWSGLLGSYEGEKLKELILEWNRKNIEVIETLNNKSVMGTVSTTMPRTIVGDVIDSMVDHGVTLFAIDARNRFLDNQETWMRHVIRTIKQRGLLDDTMIYVVNARIASFSKNADVVLARDFLNAGYGADILGGLHIPNPGAGKAKEAQMKKGLEPTCRIFDEETYGYSKMAESVVAKKLGIAQSLAYQGSKKYNLARQIAEAKVITEALNSEKSILPYLQTKNMIDAEKVDELKKYRKSLFEKEATKSKWFD